MRFREFSDHQLDEGALDFMKSTAKDVKSAVKNTLGWAHRKITKQHKPLTQYREEMGIAKQLEMWNMRVQQLKLAGLLDDDLSKPENVERYIEEFYKFATKGLSPTVKQQIDKPTQADIKNSKSMLQYLTKTTARIGVLTQDQEESNTTPHDQPAQTDRQNQPARFDRQEHMSRMALMKKTGAFLVNREPDVIQYKNRQFIVGDDGQWVNSADPKQRPVSNALSVLFDKIAGVPVN